MKYVGTVSTNLFNALEEAFEEYKESLGKAQEKAIKKKIKNSPERQFHRENTMNESKPFTKRWWIRIMVLHVHYLPRKYFGEGAKERMNHDPKKTNFIESRIMKAK